MTDLERRIAGVQAEARECVLELLVDDEPAQFLIAQRLPGLGSAVLPTIHELLADPARLASRNRHGSAPSIPTRRSAPEPPGMCDHPNVGRP